MPQHKSAAKRVRTSAKERARNRTIRTRLRGVLKAFDGAAAAERPEALRAAISEVDRAAQKGVIPKARANRKKSRLARAFLRQSQ